MSTTWLRPQRETKLEMSEYDVVWWFSQSLTEDSYPLPHNFMEKRYDTIYIFPKIVKKIKVEKVNDKLEWVTDGNGDI